METPKSAKEVAKEIAGIAAELACGDKANWKEYVAMACKIWERMHPRTVASKPTNTGLPKTWGGVDGGPDLLLQQAEAEKVAPTGEEVDPIAEAIGKHPMISIPTGTNAGINEED